jgi:hypothetical protein
MALRRFAFERNFCLLGILSYGNTQLLQRLRWRLEMKVNGVCHCGAIRFEAIVDEGRAAICHCADCQNLSGTAYRAVVPASSLSFRLLSGQPKQYVKTAQSGNKRVHAFCPDCGTPIYACSLANNPPTYNLRLGTLQQRHMIAPRSQQWCSSALDWAIDIGGLPSSDRGS